MPRIEVGDIVKFWCKDIDPPKFKYAICIATPSLLYVLINSKDRKIYDSIPLKKGKRFPKHESYISFNNLYQNDSGSAEVIDIISNDDLSRLLIKIKESRVITSQLKEIIFGND